MAAFVLACCGSYVGIVGVRSGGGGLFGGLFRGRANMGGNGNLGYYPYYGAVRATV